MCRPGLPRRARRTAFFSSLLTNPRQPRPSLPESRLPALLRMAACPRREDLSHDGPPAAFLLQPCVLPHTPRSRALNRRRSREASREVLCDQAERRRNRSLISLFMLEFNTAKVDRSCIISGDGMSMQVSMQTSRLGLKCGNSYSIRKGRCNPHLLQSHSKVASPVERQRKK